MKRKPRKSSSILSDNPVQDVKRENNDRRSRVHSRVTLVYGLIVMSCAGLIFRLSYLQITKGAQFREAANSSATTIAVLPARGRIYDANGNLLAYDKPVYSVYYTQISKINTSDAQVAHLSQLLAREFHCRPSYIENMIISNQKNDNYATIRLFKNATKRQLTFIGERQSQLPGINIQVDGQRTYPYGDLAGQVLGFVGPITSSQQGTYLNQLNYQYNQIIGQAGLEAEYEKYLKGRIGKQIVQTSLDGSVVNQSSYSPKPTPGYNLKLTLDGHLEAQASIEVQNAIQQYERVKHVKISDAAAVVMDVKTGGVLAMVSYPYLDPNWFVNNTVGKHAKYLSTPGVYQNNVIDNPHYPGSTVKPANLLAGLESGVITPNYVFNDTPGPLKIGTYPMTEDASYGPVNDTKAIAVSDDKFFYNLGLTLGKWIGSSSYSGGFPEGGFANLQHWRNTSLIKGLMTLIQGEMRFGLGTYTGIDLPGENKGSFYIDNAEGNQVPLDIAQVKRQLVSTGSYENAGSPVNLAFTAFGQGQQVTPMELVQYIATLATGGKRLQPHLLDEVLPGGIYPSFQDETSKLKPIKEFPTTVQAHVKLNKQYLSIVQQGMYDACNQPYGTAYYSFSNAPYKAAGKTGTAEIAMGGKPINNSVFIGYAPYNDPQIAVAVMVPGAGFGAVTAVPIARAIMDDYFDEHHAAFMPKTGWNDTTIPATWMHSPAYQIPEEAK